MAVVFKRPLPYLYLAPDTFTAAGVPYRTFDRLPLAAEPAVTVIDLVLDALETRFVRSSLIALLNSPHLRTEVEGMAVTRESIGSLNRQLSDQRYLGGLERLEQFAGTNDDALSRPALSAAISLARALSSLVDPAPASRQLQQLASFLADRLQPIEGTDPVAAREHQARGALVKILSDLEAAHAAHHDPDWTIADLAAAVRRWIGEEAVAVPGSAHGVWLVGDQAARYGDFDDVTIVGLVEDEWPEPLQRNLFYPSALLKALGWPSEKDRRQADTARFLDLVASPRQRVEVSTFMLDADAIVSRSLQLDDLSSVRLSRITEPVAPTPGALDADAPEWRALRATRTSGSDPAFHGFAGPGTPRTWSVSALETYLGCPFKFFAQHVLRLQDEPDDEEVMDPRRQGQLVHDVFEIFFREWQRTGRKAITAANLEDARTLFSEVVDRALERLSEGEAALERTRLLGSPAASGLGDAVFRMEAERPVPVVDRLLEYSLQGPFVIVTKDGPRTLDVRGKTDRVDLLADGTFRLIDYKLGWPPDKNRALQLPVYSLCVEQQLNSRGRGEWRLGEAVYLAFKGPKRVVPLFTSPESRVETLARAQQRLGDTIDAIDRGEFPPAPDDVFRCETCSFAAVCRKDYVGDV
jgi:RecB family exonuclease